MKPILRRLTRKKGIVTEWNYREGFGYIKYGGECIFTPRASLVSGSNLTVGRQVEFNVVHDVDKKYALLTCNFTIIDFYH